MRRRERVSEMDKYIQDLKMQLSIAEAIAYFIDENDEWMEEKIK
jgi:hypothetical protein